MLAGYYVVVAGYRKPQRITVKQVSPGSYSFTWVDSRGLNRVFQSDYVGYGVTVFRETGFGLRRFVVKGRWEEVFYRDHSGQLNEVKIHADEEID